MRYHSTVSNLNPGAYSAILKTRAAYRFDFGTFLMRLFSYTTTIGTISTLTLAGASALEATSVSSLIAVFTFIVAPRVSKRIDERGQSAVVPFATTVALAGLALMLCTTQFGLPFWLNYIAAPLISFLPNAQALARARWTYLITTGQLGDDTPPLKTAYAYEGILEDIAFMVGPAAVIAVSAATIPIAGMALGATIYAIGAALLISSRDTEPEPGWGTDTSDAKGASVFRTSPVVRALFVIMVFFGAVYGSFDTATISYAESIDFAMLASIAFAAESVFSVIVSAVFGMLGFNAPLRKQFLAVAVLFGCLYGLFAFVNSPVSLIVIACISSIAYSPFFITANVTCEAAVPSANLTEAISWIGSGMSAGMVLGPLTAGAVVDAAGPLAGFYLCATYAICVAVLTVCFIPLMRRAFK